MGGNLGLLSMPQTLVPNGVNGTGWPDILASLCSVSGSAYTLSMFLMQSMVCLPLMESAQIKPL